MQNRLLSIYKFKRLKLRSEKTTTAATRRKIRNRALVNPNLVS